MRVVPITSTLRAWCSGAAAVWWCCVAVLPVWWCCRGGAAVCIFSLPLCGGRVAGVVAASLVWGWRCRCVVVLAVLLPLCRGAAVWSAPRAVVVLLVCGGATSVAVVVLLSCVWHCLFGCDVLLLPWWLHCCCCCCCLVALPPVWCCRLCGCGAAACVWRCCHLCDGGVALPVGVVAPPPVSW
jgi:hypothetical protein